jgi:glycosyltransferase involved in cell wall biosynthesis
MGNYSHKIPCSVAILTFNSGSTLKRALESVSNFSEIIICDGGSTDETLALARAFGTKLLVQAPEFKGEGNKIIDFSGVRNQMLDASSNRWFFYLDSDEVMTVELEKEISEIISSNHPASAFWVPRKYQINEDVIDCASTYPTNSQMRFFHKDAVNKFIKTIHERIEVKEGATILKLQNFMLVPFNSDPEFHRKKWQHYIDLEFARIGKVSWSKWVLMCLENLKISTLYLYRYLRNSFFCKGTKMPWALEWERHVYHLNLCKKFFPLNFKNK